MKTLKWTGVKGNEIELKARCKIELVDKVVEVDGYVIETGEKEQKVDAILELWVDGKKIETCWNINFWKVIDTRNGVKKIWGLKVGMTPEQAEVVEKFLNEIIEEGKTEEVKAAEQAEKEAERQAEIDEAKKIIEKAGKQDKVMTNAEYAKWRKGYNNLMNEGGEGYIPSLVTAEQLEWAKQVLKEEPR